MTPVLEVNGLTKTFRPQGRPAFTAVDNVSFTLHKGEKLGIVGGSGCGKSTVAKLVTRLIEPTAGSARLDGTEIIGLRGKALREVYRKIQMVFQTPVGSFDPRRTLGDGIGESLKNRGVPKAMIRERVESLLAQCGLEAEFAKRYPHEISGGQCQRAAIARALAPEPEIVILDEATSGLDVTVQKQVMELLERLQRESGVSYLFICHSFALVQMFCDRVLVMCEGRIIEEGTPDDVIFHPKADYTKMLIDSIL